MCMEKCARFRVAIERMPQGWRRLQHLSEWTRRPVNGPMERSASTNLIMGTPDDVHLDSCAGLRKGFREGRHSIGRTSCARPYGSHDLGDSQRGIPRTSIAAAGLRTIMPRPTR
jgi:hypothetical protein